jgi:N-glycosidase YbiA
MARKKVLFYEGRWYMFSNFSAFIILWRERAWSTVEHAYQAAKFESKVIQTLIWHAPSPYEAKRIAEKHKSKRREDWHEVKLTVMEELLRAKLAQHEYVRECLLETGTDEIIENSPTDSYWGWGPDKKGANWMGKIWMKLRAELPAA